MQKKNKTSILKQDKVFGQLSWPRKEKNRKKEKRHLFNITWHSYTADHTACLWNQNGCPDTAIEGFRCLARLYLVVNHLK